MSNRIFVENYILFRDPNVNVNNISFKAEMIGRFINGKPERFIEDHDFWEELYKIAVSVNINEQVSLIFNCRSEFNRTCLFIVIFENDKVLLHSKWWNKLININLKKPEDILKIKPKRSFCFNFSNNKVVFEGEKKTYNKLLKEHQMERDLISQLGGQLITPLRYS